jgi:hypothetical protein
MLLPVPLSPLSVQSRLLDAPHNERPPSTAWFSRSRRMSRLHFSALYCVLLRSIAEVFESRSLKSTASALFAQNTRGGGYDRGATGQPVEEGLTPSRADRSWQRTNAEPPSQLHPAWQRRVRLSNLYSLAPVIACRIRPHLQHAVSEGIS